MGRLVPEGCHAGADHGVLHPAADLRLGKSKIHRPEGDIPVHVGGEELIVRVLEHQPHPAAELRQIPAGIGNGRFVQENLARLRGEHTVEVEKQGGFACPVAAQNTGDFSRFRSEGDSPQSGRAVGVGIGEFPCLNGIAHGRSPLSAARISSWQTAMAAVSP